MSTLEIRDRRARRSKSVKSIAIVALIVLALVGAALLFLQRGYVYEVSEADIQRRIESQFPVKKCVLVFCIELDEPFVRLTDGETRIEFGSKALMEIAFSNDEYAGSAGFSGQLDYARDEGAFYLSESKLGYLKVTGVSAEHKENLDHLAALLVSEYLRTNPIYSFKDTSFELIAQWLELKEVRVKERVLQIRLGPAF